MPIEEGAKMFLTTVVKTKIVDQGLVMDELLACTSSSMQFDFLRFNY